jgi:hypothetical protein
MTYWFDLIYKWNLTESVTNVNIVVIIPPLPEGGGGYTVFPLSFRPSFALFSVTVDGRNLMKLVTKYQIPVINSCLEKCNEKWAYMFNVYKNQQSRQTGSRNLMGPKTLPTIWYTYEDTVLPLSVLSSVQDIFRRTFLSNYWRQESDIWSQASYRYTILWVAFYVQCV